MNKGKFITFEGCDGVGKSTQLKLLKNYLDENKIDYILTREPGGAKVSEKIREILKSAENNICPECEALLYAAARAQIIEETIIPALNENKLVVCDRFIDSSLAYQGAARNLGEDVILSINAFAMKNIFPDLTVFLDLNPKDAFLRKGGADSSDRLEMETLEFHDKIYRCYLALADKYSERIIKVNAARSENEIQNEIIKILKERKIIC